MKIFFRSRKLKKVCEDPKAMLKELGRNRAKKLRQRMVELKAADVLADISHLPPPRLHELTGQQKGQFSVDVAHPYRLLFIPADDPVPTKDDGGLDLQAVETIEIVDIVDTHG